jgi:hypothetical protein
MMTACQGLLRKRRWQDAGRRTGGGLRRVLGPGCLILGLSLAPPISAALAGEGSAVEAPKTLVLPLVSIERGRRLFVNKGCVICHSINGIGGQAAAALDAAPGQTSIDILDFVARLLLGASAMLDLQATELGYQIGLIPQEIGDLAAFVYDPEAQGEFSYDEVPVPLQDWILNEPYWDFEEWPETLPEVYPDLGDGTDL